MKKSNLPGELSDISARTEALLNSVHAVRMELAGECVRSELSGTVGPVILQTSTWSSRWLQVFIRLNCQFVIPHVCPTGPDDITRTKTFRCTEGFVTSCFVTAKSLSVPYLCSKSEHQGWSERHARVNETVQISNRFSLNADATVCIPGMKPKWMMISCTDDTQMIHRWYTDDIQMMYRWYTGDVQIIYKSYTDHIQITYRSFKDDVQIMYRLYTQTMYRPYTDHIQTMYRSYTDHIQLICRWYTNAIHMMYRWCTDHIQIMYRPYTGDIQIIYRWFPSSSWSCRCPCGCGSVVRSFLWMIICIIPQVMPVMSRLMI